MSDAVVAIGSVVDDDVRTATLDVLNDEAQVVFLQDQPPAARAETLRNAAILIVSRVGRDVSPEELAHTKGLRLVQFLSAGVDGIGATSAAAGDDTSNLDAALALLRAIEAGLVAARPSAPGRPAKLM